jgi:hypothetical protein
MQIEAADLVRAVELLEGRNDLVGSWTLAKINNDQHALSPHGRGVGIQIMSLDGKRLIFEKAGEGVSVTQAAETAIRRLEVALETATTAAR